MSKKAGKEKPSVMSQLVKAFNEGALRGESPRIETTVHVSDGLHTFFRGSPHDPEALKWLDP